MIQNLNISWKITIVTEPSEQNELSALDSIDLKDFFYEGTQEIYNYLDSNLINKNLIHKYMDLILKTFGGVHPWYNDLKYFDKNNNICFILIPSKVFRRLFNDFFSKETLLKSVIDPTISNSTKPSFNMVELENKLQKTLGVSSIPKEWVETLINEGLFKMVINDEKLSKNLTSPSKIRSSVIFTSLKFSARLIDFLKNSNASMYIIDLYTEILKNPLLLFNIISNANIQYTERSINNKDFETLLEYFIAFHSVFNSDYQKTIPALEFSAIKDDLHDLEIISSTNTKLKLNHKNIYESYIDFFIYIHTYSFIEKPQLNLTNNPIKKKSIMFKQLVVFIMFLIKTKDPINQVVSTNILDFFDVLPNDPDIREQLIYKVIHYIMFEEVFNPGPDFIQNLNFVFIHSYKMVPLFYLGPLICTQDNEINDNIFYNAASKNLLMFKFPIIHKAIFLLSYNNKTGFLHLGYSLNEILTFITNFMASVFIQTYMSSVFSYTIKIQGQLSSVNSEIKNNQISSIDFAQKPYNLVLNFDMKQNEILAPPKFKTSSNTATDNILILADLLDPLLNFNANNNPGSLGTQNLNFSQTREMDESDSSQDLYFWIPTEVSIDVFSSNTPFYSDEEFNTTKISFTQIVVASFYSGYVPINFLNIIIGNTLNRTQHKNFLQYISSKQLNSKIIYEFDDSFNQSFLLKLSTLSDLVNVNITFNNSEIFEAFNTVMKFTFYNINSNLFLPKNIISDKDKTFSLVDKDQIYKDFKENITNIKKIGKDLKLAQTRKKKDLSKIKLIEKDLEKKLIIRDQLLKKINYQKGLDIFNISFNSVPSQEIEQIILDF